MVVKFIHSADIHLDSPLRGLERYEGAPVDYVRGASRQAFKNLVDLSLEEEVDFVVIAGDLYDGDWKDYNTGLFFVSQVSRLREAGIKVFTIRGNHDAASQITRSLRLPNNVVELSTDRPGTVELDELGIAIHGQGFASRSVTDDLSITYPEPLNEYFNIGLLHTCADGREGHDPYAPCSVNYLVTKGYDYWALGHVHNREVLHDGAPWVVFPGNIQGRHARETGPKGCTLVRVFDGQVDSVEHRDLDVLRWTVCEVNAGDLINPGEVLDKALEMAKEEIDRAEGRLVALRFVISGSTRAHQAIQSDPDRWINNLRAEVSSASGGEAWVEKVKIRTANKANLEEIAESHHPVAFLLKFMQNLPKDTDLVEELAAELDDLRNVIPAELFGKGSDLNFRDPNTMREILAEVEQLVITQLLNKGEFAE